MTGRRSGGLAVTLCRDSREFAALCGEWEALHRRCATATPFQSHAWLRSWWISYGQEGRLRVLLVRRAGRLIGAAPLMLVHRPMPLLVPMGGAVSDFFDILLDEEEAGYAVGALRRGLDRAARHTVVDLREVRPDASAQLLFGRWPGPRSRLTDSTCMELPAEPLGDLAARLTGSRGQRLRAKLRRVDALGVEARRIPQDGVPAAIGALLRLHERQWEGRGVNPEHLRARFSDHLIRSVGRMTAEGTAAVTEFRLKGEVVASNLSLQSGRLVGGYLYGADPALREQKVDVSTMLLREVARQASDGGHEVLSLLRGAERYKNHWQPVPVVNQRLLLARPGLEPLLRLRESQVAVRERAAQTVKSRFPAARDWRERLTALPAHGR
ncbi:GNAT family N-acetyltransferase [Streptomyces pratensis]|uniref:GNAT family N-acetyltransferase n=1 Tax=Streptomyces pratensis TaxID=1169025 RepID=UPI0030186A2F